jgi:hypothetical protein
MAVAGMAVSVLAMFVPWFMRVMAGRTWHGI